MDGLMDSGSYTGALLRDLSKAFDSVPHQLLLREVVEIGCSTKVLDWFCNYLTDRLPHITSKQKNRCHIWSSVLPYLSANSIKINSPPAWYSHWEVCRLSSRNMICTREYTHTPFQTHLVTFHHAYSLFTYAALCQVTTQLLLHRPPQILLQTTHKLRKTTQTTNYARFHKMAKNY